MTVDEHRVDFWSLTVRRIHGKPDEWVWRVISEFDLPYGFVRVTGGTPVGTYRSGKKKGLPKFPSKLESVFVTREQLVETMKLWEELEGRCSKCYGSGDVVISASVKDGVVTKRRKKCKACRGTGGRNER